MTWIVPAILLAILLILCSRLELRTDYNDSAEDSHHYKPTDLLDLSYGSEEELRNTLDVMHQNGTISHDEYNEIIRKNLPYYDK